MKLERQRTRFTIDVTEKDIEKAKRNDSYTCVVSQALARAIPDATRIETDTQAIRFTMRGQRFVYLTPYAVQGYVVAFDAGDEIRPFSFTIHDPKRARTRRRTAEGRKADLAGVMARKRVRRKAAAAGKSPTDPAVVAAARAAATAAYRAASDATAPHSAAVEPGQRQPPPRVFRHKMRSYGHRLLRINQQQQQTTR